MSFPQRHTLISLGFWIMLTCVAALIIMARVEHSTQRDAAAGAEADALAVARDMMVDLGRFDSAANVLAASPELAEQITRPDNPVARARMVRLLDSVADATQLANVFVTDETGVIAFAGGKNRRLLEGRPVNSLDAVREVLYFSRPSHFIGQSLIGDGQSYFVGVPLRQGDKTMGAVVVEVSSTAFRINPVDAGDIVLVLDPTDSVAMTSDPAWRFAILGRNALDLHPVGLNEPAAPQPDSLSGENQRHSYLRDNGPGMATPRLAQLKKGERVFAMSDLFGGWAVAILRRPDEIIFAQRAAGGITLLLGLLGWMTTNMVLNGQRHLRQLRDKSIRDALTGLYNRSYMNEAMLPIIAATDRSLLQGLAMVMVDIDNFKSINDTFGHHTGDMVIQKLADTIRHEARKSDVAIRMGGEEFAIFLPGTDTHGALVFADRLRQAFSDEVGPLPDGRRATLSAGVSLHRSGDTLEGLIKSADDALYDAKRTGRDRVVEARPMPAVLEPA